MNWKTLVIILVIAYFVFQESERKGDANVPGGPSKPIGFKGPLVSPSTGPNANGEFRVWDAATQTWMWAKPSY